MYIYIYIYIYTYVLVGVDEDEEAVVGGAEAHGPEVVEVLLVVLARPRVLHGLPGHEEPEQLEAPGAEPREVRVELVQGAGPTDEGHLGRHDLSEATCLMRPRLFLRQYLSNTAN